MGLKEGSFYHRVYPLAQRVNALGAWNITEAQHIDTLKDSVTTTDPVVLYCGTATGRNPIDAQRALSENGYAASMVTMDLSSYPLRQMHDGQYRVQASATQLPFPDKAFDVITTDFLTNMVSLESLREIAKEWSRVLKEDGIISTNTFLSKPSLEFDSLYQRFLRGFAGKKFCTQEALEIALQCEGLKTVCTGYEFSQKPYLYPDSPYHLKISQMNENEREERMQEAQQIWRDAQNISAVTKQESNLTPRQMSEVITDIVHGNYIFDRDDDGIRAFGRSKPLTADWYELGPAYVRPDARGNGLGRKLVADRLALLEGKNMVTFTNNPITVRLFESYGFVRSGMGRLPANVLRVIRDDRIGTLPRIVSSVKAGIHRDKVVLVREAQLAEVVSVMECERAAFQEYLAAD